MGVGDVVYQGGGGATAGIDLQIGGNTSGTTALVSSGTLTLVGGNNITLSQNGNAITISAAASNTLTEFWPAINGGYQSKQFGQSTVHVDPVWVPAYVSATRANVWLSVSLSTSSNSSHAGTLSLAMGLYTNNASTLSLVTSGSTNYVWTNTSDNSSASLQGIRVVSIPINITMSPGNYWLGYLSQTATANANWITLSQMALGNNSNSGSFGGGSSGTFAAAMGNGHWSVQTASIPNAMAFTDLRNNAPADNVAWGITFQNATA